MSKYRNGAYHYEDFAKDTPYRHHVLDLIEVIKKHVTPNGDILDVGCGEGLIMSKLTEKGFKCLGLEIDDHAILWAKHHGNKVSSTDIFDISKRYDAVLLCDSLEHIEEPDKVVDHCRGLAPVIVIAIPDRHDPHAINELDDDDILDYFDDEEWQNVHHDRRHARHLLVFKRVS